MKNYCAVSFILRSMKRFLISRGVVGCVLTLGLCEPLFAQASERQRDVQKFTLIVGSKTVRTSKVFDSLPELLKNSTFKIKHPHKIVDPKSQELEYSGIELRKLLEMAGVSKSQVGKLSDLFISFVGRDGYTVTLPFADALAARSFVTGYQTGNPLNWRSGAPFLAFADTSKHDYLTEQSWWAWWVSVIIIGEPKISLKVEDSVWDEKKLATVCNDKLTATMSQPRGRRKKDILKGFVGEVTQCKLDQLVSSLKTPSSKTTVFKADFYTGQTLRISEPSKYRVVYKFNQNPIPSSYGGTIQLCEIDGKQECRYFLEKISKVD